jgi:hypothetical protein
MAAAQWNSIWEKRRLPDIIESGGICRPKERSRERPRHPHTRWARPGLGRAPYVCGALEPPLCLVFWLCGSSGEIGFLMIFLNFY